MKCLGRISLWWRGNYSKCNSSHRTFAPRSGTWQIIVWTVPTGAITVSDGGKEGGGQMCEMIKSLWSEGSHGSVIRDRKTERQPKESSDRYWRWETKRRWMVRKQNNMVVATVGFSFHTGHDRSLKSWVGFTLPSTSSSSLCRLCRADFLFCCHKYDCIHQRSGEEYCRRAEVGFGWFCLCNHSVLLNY